MLQGNCSPSWLGPMVTSFPEWATSISDCSIPTSPGDWTSPFSHAFSSLGLLCAVWVCESSWPWNSGPIHVHHGSRETYSSYDICGNYSPAISKTLLCTFTVQDMTQSPHELNLSTKCHIQRTMTMFIPQNHSRYFHFSPSGEVWPYALWVGCNWYIWKFWPQSVIPL